MASHTLAAELQRLKHSLYSDTGQGQWGEFLEVFDMHSESFGACMNEETGAWLLPGEF